MSNVIPLRQKRPEQNSFSPSLLMEDQPLAVNVPPGLARSIRFTAGMAGKDPQIFILDWLKSGFPENAA